MKKIVTLCMLLALWTGAIAESLTSVSYYDPALEDDNKMTTTPDGVEVTVLDGSETSIPGGWYVISQNVTFNQTLVITGDVTLILADGTQTKMEQANGSPLPYNGMGANRSANSSELFCLTIYTQSIGENAGRLSIRTTQDGIYAKEVSINGAVLDIWYNTAQSWATSYNGIFGYNNLNFTDSHVTISGPDSGKCTPLFSPAQETPIDITRTTLTITGAAGEAICFPMSYLTIADSKVRTTTMGSNFGTHVKGLEIRNSEVTASSGNETLFADSYVAISDSRVTATSLGKAGSGIKCNIGEMTIESGEVTCSAYNGIYAEDILIKDATVYCDAQNMGIHGGRNLTIEGGKVTASGDALGLYATTLNIEGGQVELTGGQYGIYADETTLGWTHADDFIRINKFSPTSNPTFAEGKRFIADGLGIATLDTDEGGYLIDGHTLYPLDGYLLNLCDGVQFSATRQGTAVGPTIYNDIAYNIFQPGDVVTLEVPEGMCVASNEVTIGRDGTFIMPEADVNIQPDTPYLDPTVPDDEQQKAALTIPLTSGTTSLDAGWYEVSGNVTLTSTLNLNGDMNIILADGATLNVEQADGTPVEGTGILSDSHSLTIYTQSIGENAGRLSIRATQDGINVGSVSINGAVLDIWYNTAQSWATTYSGIFGFKNLNLTDAHVTISGPDSGKCTPYSSATTNTQNAITRSTLTITGAASAGISFPTANLTIADSKVTTSGSNYGIHSNGLEIRNSEVTASSGKDAIFSAYGVSITDSRVTATSQGTSGFGIMCNSGDMTIEGSEVACIGNRGIHTNGNAFIKDATVECPASYIGIYASKNLTIEGGKVTASGDALGIYASILNIEGGQVELTGGQFGIHGKEANLGWTRADDYIQVSKFHEQTSIVANSTFVIEGTNTILDGSVSDHSVLSDNPMILRPCIVLSDANDNTSTIAEGAALTSDEQTIAVALDGRTLFKDGHWNTLCLPFDLYLNNSVLDGDDVRLITLDDALLSDGTLTLDFAWTNVIEAGVPYLIKWENTGQHLTNPVFQGVVPNSATPADKAVVKGDLIRFEGCYSPVAITDEEGDNTKLYLGEGDMLNYPSGPMTIGSCRAYFQLLGGHTAGEPEPGMQGIRAFELNFGEEETGIEMVHGSRFMGNGSEWYTIDGRRIAGKPAAKGVYFSGGRKVMIE